MDEADVRMRTTASIRLHPFLSFTNVLVGRASPQGVRVVQVQKDLSHSPHVDGIREGQTEQDFWGSEGKSQNKF